MLPNKNDILNRVARLSLLLFLCVHSAVIFAHTPLKSSVPQAKSVLQEAPKEIQLQFTGAVKLLTLKLSDGDKKAIDIDFTPGDTASKTFSHLLPPLSDGSYLIEWNALGDDGHKLRGLIAFTIDANATAAMSHQHDNAHHHDEAHEHSH